MKQHILWFYHIHHEDMKLTKLVLHFSNFFAIFYAFYKHCCSVLIRSSDPVSEVPTPIRSFEFLPIIGARPTQNKCVGSSDKVSEVPITIESVRFLSTKGARPATSNRVGSSDPMSGVPTSTFSTKNRNPYCRKTNQQKSKPF